MTEHERLKVLLLLTFRLLLALGSHLLAQVAIDLDRRHLLSILRISLGKLRNRMLRSSALFHFHKVRLFFSKDQV